MHNGSEIENDRLRSCSQAMLFFCKWWYTNLLTNSRIQMSQTLTKIGIIAKPTVRLVNNTKSKIFWNLNDTVQFTFRFGHEIEQY